MKKNNSLVLLIALLVLSAMFLFTACSSNNVPLDNSFKEEEPFDDTKRSGTTKNNTQENDSTVGIEAVITDKT